MKKHQTRVLVAGGMAVLAGISLAGCSSNGSGPNDSEGTSQVNVTLKSDGGKETCALDTTEAQAGPVTFTVTNESAPSISEVELLHNQKIIGEKENLAPGLDAVSFTSTLDGGDYKIYCPGADTEYVDFTVTGEAAAPSGSTQDILKQGVATYGLYITDQVAQLDATVKTLDEKVQAGDLEGAKTVYAAARPYYERAESAVDGFQMPGNEDPEDNTKNLDYLIDMRESNLDEAAGWHGFHAIERDLWQGGEITDQTKAYSTELVSNVDILNTQVIPTFTEDLKPEDLANGAADLLEEVATTKITGEEEAYSRIDLVDFAGNVEGSQQAYAALRDGLEKIDADLVSRIDQEYQDVQETLDGYRDSSALGGFKAYTAELKASDSEKLTKAIQPLHDDLASLAEKVATAQ